MCTFLDFRALGQDELTLDNSTSHQHVALLLKESSLSAQNLFYQIKMSSSNKRGRQKEFQQTVLPTASTAAAANEAEAACSNC